MPLSDALSQDRFYERLRSDRVAKLQVRLRARFAEFEEFGYLPYYHQRLVVGIVIDGYDVRNIEDRGIGLVVEFTRENNEVLRFVIYSGTAMPTKLIIDESVIQEQYLDNNGLQGERTLDLLSLEGRLPSITNTSYIPLTYVGGDEQLVYSETKALTMLYDKCPPGCFPDIPEVAYYLSQFSD